MAAGEQVTISNISIHSPRMGRDAGAGHGGLGKAISIHSPRMGRDLFTLFEDNRAINHFNPLSPHGERHNNKNRH